MYFHLFGTVKGDKEPTSPVHDPRVEPRRQGVYEDGTSQANEDEKATIFYKKFNQEARAI